MESFGAPKHILEDQEKSQALYVLLEEENAHIDDVIKNFKATGNELADKGKLYKLLRLDASGWLGTMNPEKTRKFYAGALRLRMQEVNDTDTLNAMEALAGELNPDGLQDVRRRAEAA